MRRRVERLTETIFAFPWPSERFAMNFCSYLNFGSWSWLLKRRGVVWWGEILQNASTLNMKTSTHQLVNPKPLNMFSNAQLTTVLRSKFSVKLEQATFGSPANSTVWHLDAAPQPRF